MADKFQVAVAKAKNEFLKLWKEHINQLKDAAEGASTKERVLLNRVTKVTRNEVLNGKPSNEKNFEGSKLLKPSKNI